MSGDDDRTVCERYNHHHGDSDTDSLAGCHDIGQFLIRLRKPYYSEEDDVSKRIAKLKVLLAKPPYERSVEENRDLFTVLRLFPCFKDISDALLSSLCSMVVMETWSAGLTVFGSTGLHVVLCGSLMFEPESTEKEDNIGNDELAESVVEEDGVSTDGTEYSNTSSERTLSGNSSAKKKLRMGSHFGTLVKLEGDTALSLPAITLEEVELMKISVSSFKHISDRLTQKTAQEVLDLIHSCDFFKEWPQKSLNEIAKCLRWCTFQKRTVLVDEGAVSDNMYLIKSGVCVVKNRVDINLNSPRRGHVQEVRQLVVGQLVAGAEVGERGAVLHLPSKSKIEVKSGVLVCGCIARVHIEEMDEVTQALFRQVAEKKETLHDEETIKRIYVEKQSEKSWQMQKRKALQEVIHHTGIEPSYGKWSRNPTVDEVKHLSAKVGLL